MTQNFTLPVINRVVDEHKVNMMKFVYISLIVVVCVVVEIKCEWTRGGVCRGCQRGEYIRIKRAKYYPGSPFRFYNKPLMSYPTKTSFGFTSSTGYLMDDARQSFNSRPKGGISRPINEGLGEEYVNNIMQFLSQQELDKIVEFASEKEKSSRSTTTESPHEKLNYIGNSANKHKYKVIYSDNVSELDNESKLSFVNANQDLRTSAVDFNNPDINDLKESTSFNIPDLESSALFVSKNQMPINTQLDSDQSMQSQQFYSFDALANQELKENLNGAFGESSIVQEEHLPKPTNLREEDFEVSYTNNVPVVKPYSNSYKIENFGSLPLMNYHSKLDSVDSYKVPHYTVTAPEKSRAPSSNAKIPVEPAPPASTAQEQSDAHLKATKIWTHKSKGTAYTLHSDGTLSLELPSRPTGHYSYP